MQNPNEDTEWNDALRRKGILPPKPKEKEISEDDIVKMLDTTIQERTEGSRRNLETLSLDELDELEDEEEERILQAMKSKRLQELKQEISKKRFGEVLEISAQDWVQEVNKAGEGVFVVLHLYKQGIPLCSLLNQYLSQLAVKFPATKFIKSISTVCIPNYPDKNVPTIFVYCEGEMKKQFIGPIALRGMNLTAAEFEFILGTTGAIPTTIKKDPRKKVKDEMMSKLGVRSKNDESDSESE